jgi:SulP family sulfate permease
MEKSMKSKPSDTMLTRVFPVLGWFKGYTLSSLRADFVSGLTVALVLVPQSMAYAQLAGLPVYYGLYAAFLPPVVASLFGSSRQLATGPVAVVSLMTATALEPLATAGSEAYIAYAILLALVVGVFQFTLGVLRLGLIVNFLSHPVVNGFTNAAALIIASSQLSKLFGVDVEKAEHHYETIYNVIKAALAHTHWPTLGLAVLAFVLMAGLKRLNPKIPNVLVAVLLTTLISWAAGFENNYKAGFVSIKSPEAKNAVQEFNNILSEIEKAAEKRVLLSAEIRDAQRDHGSHSVEVIGLQYQMRLVNLKISELKERRGSSRSKIRAFRFEAGKEDDGKLRFFIQGQLPANKKGDGKRYRLKVGNDKLADPALNFVGGGTVVGNIPQGLPSVRLPRIDFNAILSLFPMAVIICLLGFMEAISIAKAIATRTGQRLDPNQELIGQGLGCIFGSFTQSYPVSGSFSRSAVNFQTGGVTGMSMVFSSAIVAATLLFFTPLLYHLPQAVLAAIIIMAVIGLVNIKGFIHTWQTQKYDGFIAIITFVCTLMFAPHLDRGIMIGVVLSLGLYLLRNMKPDIALLCKYSDDTYRCGDRFNLESCRHIAVIRFNGSLFFANVNYLEEQVLEQVADMPDLKHILLVGNGINELDASGEEMLSVLVDRLREAGYGFSISGLNDSVLDVLRRTHLYEKIGEDHLFPNVTMAMSAIHDKAHENSSEEECPLTTVCFRGLPVSDKVKRRDVILAGPGSKDGSKDTCTEE